MQMDKWDLIAKYLSGEATAQEREKFEMWLDQDEVNRQEFEDLKKIWETPLNEELFPEEDLQWQDILAAAEAKVDATPIVTLRPWWRGPVGMAAALAALLALTYLVFNTITTPTMQEPVAVVTDTASTTAPVVKEFAFTATDSVEIHVLPDYSIVWLKQGSTLRYDSEFGNGRRLVEMQGEAFFDVSRDTLNPFIIQTGVIETRVLGTRFQVNRRENGNVEVIVESGKVSVLHATDLNSSPAILEAGDAVRYVAEADSMSSFDHEAEAAAKAQVAQKKHWRRHKRASSIKAEKLRPQSFLSVNPEWKQNLVRLTVVEGTIASEAKNVSYKNIVLRVVHTSQKTGKVVTRDIAIEGTVAPGQALPFKKKMVIDWFRNPEEIKIDIIAVDISEE